MTVYFSSLHNFVMFKDICKWDLLPLSDCTTGNLIRILKMLMGFVANGIVLQIHIEEVLFKN